MNPVWNDENVTVFRQTTTFFNEMELWVEGAGSRHYTNEDGYTHSLWFTWRATVTNKGWLVEITGETGRKGDIQGLTYNLPLEVASISQRLM